MAEPQPLIICVDDKESVRKAIAMIFNAYAKGQYELHFHTQGTDALGEIRGLKDEIKNGRQVILLTDHDMPPGMSGTVLLETLAKEGIALPTVMLTSNIQEAQSLKEAGLVDVAVEKTAAKPVVDAIPTAIAAYQKRTGISGQVIGGSVGDVKPTSNNTASYTR